MLLKDIPSDGGLLLDGLTIQSAVRILSLASHDFRRVYPPPLDLRVGKWDYELNDAFRVGMDISALAQVVQSLIIGDRIYIDDQRLPSSIKLASGPDHVDLQQGVSLLAPHVVPLRLAARERLDTLRVAALGLKTLLKDDALKTYINLIAHSGVDAAFLDISDAYFKTGLSDPVFSAPEWRYTGGDMLEFIKGYSPSGADAGDSVAAWKAVLRRKTRSGLVLRRMVRRAYQARRIADLMNSSPAQHVLHDLPIGTHDTPGAARDVLRHVLATLFNVRLAEVAGLTYAPHILRSHFAAFAAAIRTVDRPSAIHHILRLVDQSRQRTTRVVRDFYGENSIELRVPLFLAMVLQDANNAKDIIPVALGPVQARL